MSLKRKEEYKLFDEENLIITEIVKLNSNINYCYNTIREAKVEFWLENNFNNRVLIELVKLDDTKSNNVDDSTAEFHIYFIDRENIINDSKEIFELYGISTDKTYNSRIVVDTIIKYISKKYIDYSLYEAYKKEIEKLPFDNYDKEVFFGFACLNDDVPLIKPEDIKNAEIVYVDRIESRVIKSVFERSLLKHSKLKEKVYSIFTNFPRVIVDGESNDYIIDRDNLIIYNKGE